jgi:adenylate kinase
MRVVLLGPPGAGKSTQARRIAERLGVPVISIGELLRKHVAERTALGRQVQPYLDAGDLVPDEITLAVARDRLSQPDAHPGFVLDDFPRTTRQADALRQLLAGMGTRLDCVLELVIPEDELIRRLDKRRQLGDPSGVRRDDDRPEAIYHRLAVYREQTAPLAEYYDAEGLLRRIDAIGPIDGVTQRALGALQAVLSHRSP